MHAEPDGKGRDGTGLFSLHWDYPPFSEHTKLITPFEASEETYFVRPVNVIGTCNGSSFVERYEDDRQQVDMWMMKEYGVMQSWAKLFTIQTPTIQIKPFRFIKTTNEVLLKYYPAVVKLVDPKTNGVSPFKINGYRKCYFLDYFVESLVLLDNLDAISYQMEAEIASDSE